MEEEKDNNQPVIILVCGIPGSGKSTLSSLLYEKFQQNCIYIDIDKIERLIHNHSQKEIEESKQKKNEEANSTEDTPTTIFNGYEGVFSSLMEQLRKEGQIEDVKQKFEFNPLFWKLSRNMSLSIVEQILSRERKINQKYLLIEDVFNLHSMRKSYFQLAQKYKSGFCEIIISMPIEEVILNDSLRSNYKQVGESVIQKSKEQFERDLFFDRKAGYLREQFWDDYLNLFSITNRTFVGQSLHHGQIKVKQKAEISEEEYQLILQQNRESIKDQLNLKLNERVGKIMKSPEFDIKNKGGGDGLSILKKLFFHLSKQQLTAQEQTHNKEEDILHGQEDLKKKYEQKFKGKSFYKEFKNVVQTMLDKIQNINLEKIKSKQKELQSKSDEDIYNLGERNDEEFDQKIEKNSVIEQYIESNSQAFEEIIRNLYE